MTVSQTSINPFLTNDSYTLNFQGSSTSSTNKPDFSVTRSPGLNAGNLSRYTGQQLLEILEGKLQVDPSGALIRSNRSTGNYTIGSRFIEPGVQFSQGNTGTIGGQFLVNSQYIVNGQPATDPNSTLGRFPVNGQFFVGSQYRQTTNVPKSLQSVPSGQYPVSQQDPITGQFTYDSTLVVNGDLRGPGPYYITSGEFINGRFQVNVATTKNGVAELAGGDIQTKDGSLLQGQIFVNGQNSFSAIYRPNLSGASATQFAQRGQVQIQGQYNSNGQYVVNGTPLQSGSNIVTGTVTSGSQQAQASIVINGRYTAGGQFLVLTPSSDSSSAVGSGSQLSYSPIEQVRSRIREDQRNEQQVLSALNAAINRLVAKLYARSNFTAPDTGTVISLLA